MAWADTEHASDIPQATAWREFPLAEATSSVASVEPHVLRLRVQGTPGAA